MALKGNLRDFSITQLLNLVNLAKKSGVLIVEGHNDTARIIFREGKLAFAQVGHEDHSLAAVLQRANKISGNQYRLLKTRAAHMPDKELGLLLINAGYVAQADILTSLQQYFIGIVRRLFTWTEGFFQFEPGIAAPSDKIALKIDLENLIIEGTRQLKEWEQLQQEIPSLDMSLKFTDRPGTNIRKINFNVEEWKVVSYINPKNTIRQIARATRMSDLEIRRVIYALLQAGLVEMIRSNSTPAIPTGRMFPTSNKEEQKSLINRLIMRIRSL